MVFYPKESTLFRINEQIAGENFLVTSFIIHFHKISVIS